MSSSADLLLHWYRAHARALPWRSPPGAPPPDPYRVWLSEIMLQQTTVAAVRGYFERFTARWPSVAALAAADEAEVMAAWAGLGYYSRARNLITTARIVARDGFPRTEGALRALPGIGPYTAAAIAAIAFGQRAVVVDGNVERVVARHFAVEVPLPTAKTELRRLVETITPATHCGDFAQAMMDLGATVCVPRNPRCGDCPLSGTCAAFANGTPAAYPRRLPKPERPERHDRAWWITRDGEVLLVRRPDRGLLGGMLGLPVGSLDGVRPGIALGTVTHVFTHFRLTLDVVAARLEPGCVLPPGAQWWPASRLAGAGLPTLFVKAAAVALREDA